MLLLFRIDVYLILFVCYPQIINKGLTHSVTELDQMAVNQMYKLMNKYHSQILMVSIIITQKHKMIIFLFILQQVTTFPTSITSSSVNSLPFAVQSKSVSLVTPILPMPKPPEIHMNFAFEWPYVGTAKAFVTFLEIQDYAPRVRIAFHISIQSCNHTNTMLYFRDYSQPDASNIKKITLRVFSFDSDLCHNIRTWQFKFIMTSNSMEQIFDTGLDASKPIITACFLINFDSSFPAAGYYSQFITSCDVTSAPTMRAHVQSYYKKKSSTLKVINLRIVAMSDGSLVYVQKRSLDSKNKNTFSTPLSPYAHVILGITSLWLNSSPIAFILDSTYTVIVSPSNISTSWTQYNCLTVINRASLPPPTPTYEVELTIIKSHSLNNNSFEIVYENLPSSLTNVNISQVRINESTKITILSLTISNSMMTILCQYSENIEGLPLQVEFDWFLDDFNSTAITSLVLQGNPPLKAYSESDRKKPRLIIILCQIIQYFYLTMFAICLLCNKLVGIQIISFIQLTFYCMIPANISNPIFSGLSQMRYVNGYNFKLEGLLQTSLPLVFSSMDIKSNFLSNVNFMLLFVALCPVMFGVLLLVSKHSNSYKHKPRTKKYAFAAICEWSFTLLFFSCYNIFSSMVVDIQSLGTKDPLSLFMSVFISLLPITALILYFFFKSHFKEFATEINQNQTIWNFSLNQSTFLSNLYPCVLGVQMILVPSFLAAESLMNSSLYIVLGIILVTTCCMVVTLPYTRLINNIRLFSNQILKMGMVCVLISCKLKINADTQISDPFVNLIFLILSFLVLGLLVNAIFVFWRTVCWIRQNGIIDMKMYLNHMGKVTKKAATIQSQDPMFYPALQYGIGRQALLDRENQKRRLNIANIKVKQQERVGYNKTNMEKVQQELRKQMIK